MGKTLATLLAIPLIAGCSVLDNYIDKRIELDRQIQQEEYFNVVNLLDQITHRNKTTIKVKGQIPRNSIGTGFVIGDKYISLAHVTTVRIGAYFLQNGQIEDHNTYLEGEDIPLIPIEINKDTDISIHQIPEELCEEYCNEGLEFNTDPRVGMTVYFMADPLNIGKTFRHAKIGRLKMYDAPIPTQQKTLFEGSIGLDTYVVNGSSGSPVLDEQGRVLGVLQSLSSGMGFFKRISEYTEFLGDKK